MPENIFAYTPPGSFYPPFLSINRLESGDVEVTVRGDYEEDGWPGAQASIVVPSAEWERFVATVQG